MPRRPSARLSLGGLVLCPVCRHDWSGAGGCCDGCGRRLATTPADLRLPGLVTLGYYRGDLARAVRAYKYGQVRRLAGPLTEGLARLIVHRGWRPRVVTHVPLHPSRRRRRGFDQAALLARNLAGALHMPWRPLLERTRATPHQARLAAAARRRNVQDAFRPTAPAPGTVLLVDDVFTTGATLGECREVLQGAGSTTVLLAVLAVAGQSHGRTLGDQKEMATPLVMPSNAPTRTWG